MRIHQFMVAGILFLATHLQTAQAADGSSGCGPAWYVFKENSILSSALRLTTNGFLFPSVTVGMTLGTSNCTKHKLVEREKASLHLVTHTRHELERQIAQGEGEQLGALALTFGCDGVAFPLFKEELKRNFSVVVPADTEAPEVMVHQISQTIRANQALAAQCQIDLG